VIRYFADATTMRLALEKGELDFAFKSFNPSDIKDLDEKLQEDQDHQPARDPISVTLCFQCKTKPIDRQGGSPGHRRGDGSSRNHQEGVFGSE
jgi:hypothetical protein